MLVSYNWGNTIFVVVVGFDLLKWFWLTRESYSIAWKMLTSLHGNLFFGGCRLLYRVLWARKVNKWLLGVYLTIFHYESPCCKAAYLWPLCFPSGNSLLPPASTLCLLLLSSTQYGHYLVITVLTQRVMVCLPGWASQMVLSSFKPFSSGLSYVQSSWSQKRHYT